jgi:hypothetical protein
LQSAKITLIAKLASPRAKNPNTHDNPISVDTATASLNLDREKRYFQTLLVDVGGEKLLDAR